MRDSIGRRSFLRVGGAITYGSRTGAFATINGLSIGGGRRFQANYGTNKLTLVVVPE